MTKSRESKPVHSSDLLPEKPLESGKPNGKRPREKLANQGGYLLKRTGKPRATIAAECGVSGPAVSQWTAGATKPSDAQRTILWARYKIPQPSWDEPVVEEAPIPPVAGGEAFDFIGTVQQLETTVTRVLALLASGGTPHEQAKIASQCAATLEKLAKLKGDDPVTRNRILKSEFWAAIKAAHLRALAPFPEASEALGKELRALETSE